MNASTPESGDPLAPARREANGSGRSREETIYLGSIMVLTLLAAVAFLTLAAWAIFVPAMGISFLFGLAVATLAYAFLGSKGHDEVRIRGLQLGGAAAVVAALILITNGPLERQLGTLEQLSDLGARAQAAEDRARAAEEAARRQLIVERGKAERISGGGEVKLLDVNTLNGAGEGPHADNKQRADREYIFRELFDRLDIQRTPAEVVAMSEDQWSAFLATLPVGKRLQVGGIPFARVLLRSSDGREQQRTMFRDSVASVLDRRGTPEAHVCMRRVLDVRERRSGEPEIIVITHSRERCQ